MTFALMDEADLLTAIYSGLTDRPVWRVFAERLRARTEAAACVIRIRPAAQENWHLLQAGTVTQSLLAKDLDQIDTLRPNRVYAADELQPSPHQNGRYMRVELPGEADLVIALIAHASGADFRARDSALLSSLSSHLQIALRILIKMEGLQMSKLLAGEAAAGFGLGWVALNARGQAIEADPVARGMIEEGRLLHQTGDRRLRFMQDDAEKMLEIVLRNPETLQTAPCAAWLSVQPPIQLLIELAPKNESASRPEARYLLQFRKIALGNDENSKLAMELFGLNQSEASLALHLVDGLTIAEAGKKIGLTLETARTYSKRIFAKTGTRGQSQLVSLLMRGVTARN